MRSPRSSAQRAAAASDRRRYGGEKQKRNDVVLIAEDIPSNIRMLTFFLKKRLGCTVIVAKDGAEVVSLFKEHVREIDCVLMDVDMPRLNGNQATQVIREYEATLSQHRKVPILRLSSDQSEADIEKSIRAGMTVMDRSLAKTPYCLRQLSDALKQYSLRKEKQLSAALSLIAKMGLAVRNKEKELRRPKTCSELILRKRIFAARGDSQRASVEGVSVLGY